MVDKKHILTCAGLRQYEGELQNLKVIKKEEVAQKIEEIREQGDLSENAKYNATRNEQKDIKLHIEELEKLLKNAEIVVEDEIGLDKVNVGCKIKLLDMEYDEEMEFYIVGSTEASSLQDEMSNKSPVGRALISRVVGECVDMETQAEDIRCRVLEIQRVS